MSLIILILAILVKIMVAKIVFNTNHIDDEFFKIFSEANSIDIF